MKMKASFTGRRLTASQLDILVNRTDITDENQLSFTQKLHFPSVMRPLFNWISRNNHDHRSGSIGSCRVGDVRVAEIGTRLSTR